MVVRWRVASEPVLTCSGGLVERLRPKEPVLPPVELFQQSGMCDEWSLARAWMEEWLKSLSWYCTVALDPMVRISQLLEGGPVVPSKWNANREDVYLRRLGLIWKCRDLVQKHGLNYQPLCLPSHFVDYGRQDMSSLDLPAGFPFLGEEGLVGQGKVNFILVD